LLGPIFIILLIGWLTIHRDYTSAIIPPIFTTLSAQWQRYTAGLIAIFLTAWSVIWLSYGSLMLINPDQNPASLTGLIQLPAFILNSASVILPAMYAKGALLLFGPSSHGRD